MLVNMDFSLHVKEILNRNNVQVGSLKFIDLETKKSIFLKRKKAILLIRNKVYERELNYLKGDIALDVSDTDLIPYLKKGQSVIVVLPTGGKKRYIVQTKISSIFVDRFQVLIMDPRSATRFSFSSTTSVKIRPVSDATVMRLQSGEIKVMRYLDALFLDETVINAGQADGSDEANEKDKANLLSGENGDCQIKDVILDAEDRELSDDLARLKTQKPAHVTIVDISCGGMCAAFKDADAGFFFIDQLLAIECSFVNRSPSPSEKGTPVHMFVFAIVRGMKKKDGTNHLHLRFLAGLPSKLQDCWLQETDA